MTPLIAALAVLWANAPAYAHDTAASGGGPSGWDLAAMALLCAGSALYAAGSRRMRRRGTPMPLRERFAFWAGSVVLLLAIGPPLDESTRRLFSAHMLQHELLVLVGAPLLVVGRPIVPWLWALPARARPRTHRLLQSRAASGAWRWATAPLVAWAAHGAAIWVWHVPSLYEAAVRSEAIHAVQHLTLVATAALLWWGLVYGRYGRAGYGASALIVFTTMVHTGALGALFTFSTAPLYPLYEQQAYISGLDPLHDQQLAGLYMWIPAGVVLTLTGVGLVLAWLSAGERRASVPGPPRAALPAEQERSPRASSVLTGAGADDAG